MYIGVHHFLIYFRFRPFFSFRACREACHPVVTASPSIPHTHSPITHILSLFVRSPCVLYFLLIDFLSSLEFTYSLCPGSRTNTFHYYFHPDSFPSSHSEWLLHRFFLSSTWITALATPLTHIFSYFILQFLSFSSSKHLGIINHASTHNNEGFKKLHTCQQ